MATQPVTEAADAPKITQAQLDLLAGALECDRKMMPDTDPEGYVKSFANAFRQAGVEYLKIEFDGSGDSGAIQGIFLDDSWKHPVEGKLRELLDEWAYELLEQTGVDWYNNDGGFGEIVFDMSEGKFSYEVNTRRTEYDTAASGEEDI